MKCPAYHQLTTTAYRKNFFTSVFGKSLKIQSPANLQTSPAALQVSRRIGKILTTTDFGRRLSGSQQTSGRTTHFV
jgi:hypothetical protein